MRAGGPDQPVYAGAQLNIGREQQGAVVCGFFEMQGLDKAGRVAGLPGQRLVLPEAGPQAFPATRDQQQALIVRHRPAPAQPEFLEGPVKGLPVDFFSIRDRAVHIEDDALELH